MVGKVTKTVECKKCGSLMNYLYTREECEEQAKDIKDKMLKANFIFMMRNNFVCENCKEIRKLSKAEVLILRAKARGS